MHTIEVLIDVVSPSDRDFRDRLEQALSLAIKRSGGTAVCDLSGKSVMFSKSSSCTRCGFSYREISPRLFSFNSPYGACTQCSGLGTRSFFDPERIIEDPEKSIEEGAIAPWKNSSYYRELLRSLADHYGFDLSRPFNKLNKNIREIILFGTGEEKIQFKRGDSTHSHDKFPGVVKIINDWYSETDSDEVRESL